MLFSFLRRLRDAGRARIQLDELLREARPGAPFVQRLEWLEELFHWVRAPGLLPVSAQIIVSGELQVSRIKYFLARLEQDASLKQRVCGTLRGLCMEMSCVDLFVRMGIPGEASIFSEFVNRFLGRVLPRARQERDLGDFCQRSFSSQADIQWLERLDADTLAQIATLFRDPVDPEHYNLENFTQDLFESLVLLCSDICSLGLSYELRRRINISRVSESPFLTLQSMTRGFGFALAQRETAVESGELARIYGELKTGFERCRRELAAHTSLMDAKGVSVELVFRLEKIDASLYRAELIAALLAGDNPSARDFVGFMARVIEDNTRRNSLSSLFSDNVSLLAKKIAERSAETGEHYIARTRKEFFVMLRAAFGGGVLTSVTGLVKIFLDSVSAAYFVKGALASLNYSLSFLFIQLCHFTLATKQPAMTAHALAEKMVDLRSRGALLRLGEELGHLLRSQLGAVSGNLLGVIPSAILWSLLFQKVFHARLLDPAHAVATLEKHSVFGFSPIYAIFTGMLLWISSLAAGWIDNWVVYRELPQALAQNRTLRIALGRERLGQLAGNFREWVGPLTANFTLGILLGMTPKVMEFFGIGLDVRHVTLATGAITFAMMSLPQAILSQPVFWKAVGGVLIIGAMNVLVSFGLSLLVAVWARRLRSAQRGRVYLLFLRKLVRKPWSLLGPGGA